MVNSHSHAANFATRTTQLLFDNCLCGGMLSSAPLDETRFSLYDRAILNAARFLKIEIQRMPLSEYVETRTYSIECKLSCHINLTQIELSKNLSLQKRRAFKHKFCSAFTLLQQNAITEKEYLTMVLHIISEMFASQAIWVTYYENKPDTYLKLQLLSNIMAGVFFVCDIDKILWPKTPFSNAYAPLRGDIIAPKSLFMGLELVRNIQMNQIVPADNLLRQSTWNGNLRELVCRAINDPLLTATTIRSFGPFIAEQSFITECIFEKNKQLNILYTKHIDRNGFIMSNQNIPTCVFATIIPAGIVHLAPDKKSLFSCSVMFPEGSNDIFLQNRVILSDHENKCYTIRNNLFSLKEANLIEGYLTPRIKRC